MVSAVRSGFVSAVVAIWSRIIHSRNFMSLRRVSGCDANGSILALDGDRIVPYHITI